MNEPPQINTTIYCDVSEMKARSGRIVSPARGFTVGCFGKKCCVNGFAFLCLIFAAALNVSLAADSKPTVQTVKSPAESELRAAVSLSLGYLAKEGEQWISDKNCNSCHHTPMLLWSHREAQMRGFAVDSKRFDEWLEWSIERVKAKAPGVEEAALLTLALPQRPAPELTALLVGSQQPDGNWKPAGQFATMQKRGMPDAQANTTRLSLLALATRDSEPAELKSAHARAVDVLNKRGKSTSMESLAFGLLFARRLGTPDEVKTMTKEILKHQRGDGGWSSFIGENMSDVLATGQVLYVLQSGDMDPTAADAIARARLWLLKAQRTDGSWSIDITHISQIDRSAPAKAKSFKETTDLYTYWGTAWATMGLMQGLPVK